MGKLTTHVSLLLPEGLYQVLQEQAKEDCRTPPNYIRWILRRYLNELEASEK